MKQGQIKDEPWFVDPEYEESIKKVIGEAIADCVTNRNEFKDKKAGELITFEGQDENYIGYTRENWNAVVLYNYVNDVIKGEENNGTAKKLIGACVNRIWREYEKIVHKDESDKVKQNLLDARKDICAYDKEFKILEKLILFAQNVKNQKQDGFSDEIYATNRNNSIVSYRNNESFSWIDSPIVKTMNALKLEYKENQLGIVSIEEKYHQYGPRPRKAFAPFSFFRFVWFSPKQVLDHLKTIKFGEDLADLLESGKLAIFNPSEEEVNEYNRLNEEANQRAMFQETNASLNSLGTDYNRRLIEDRAKHMGIKKK